MRLVLEIVGAYLMFGAGWFIGSNGLELAEPFDFLLLIVEILIWPFVIGL